MDIPILSGIKGPHQVRAIQAGLQANFTNEAGQCLGRYSMQRQDLDSALATHHLMNGLEDLPHPPLADPFGDQIRPQAEFGPPGTELIGLIAGQE
jgi:hypothetical protein